MSNTEDILFEKRGEIGLVTLNRPKALNTLTADMCIALHAKLDEWAVDDDVLAVVVIGAGDKAFCAGGDVISLYKSGKAFRDGDKTSLEWQRFFREEYRMNVAIKEFPKPYISILDGITMGGGVGVSVHGRYRIATDKTMFAMPETGIGLIPDVGGGWFLPRLEDELGMFLALTGERLGPEECCELGITQWFCASKNVDRLVGALAKCSDDISGVITRYSEKLGPSKLLPHRAGISAFFAGSGVEEIIEALESSGSLWAQEVYKRLKKKSPTSLHLTYHQMRRGKVTKGFRENMIMEFRVVNRIILGNDFYEGVRALLLDKDNNPKWDPESLRGVSDTDIKTHFEPLGKDELNFE